MSRKLYQNLALAYGLKIQFVGEESCDVLEGMGKEFFFSFFLFLLSVIEILKLYFSFTFR